MAETEQTKVCPHCAETIKAAAKVCPYCRKSRRRWDNLTPYDFVAILTTVLAIGTVLVTGGELRHERDFGLDKNKVLVTSFHFDLAKHANFTNVVVVGVLTNGSRHTWRIEDFQVRYLDKDWKVFDFGDPVFDSFAILPHSDHAFRLNMGSTKSVPKFTTCTVQVASAHDPRVPN